MIRAGRACDTLRWLRFDSASEGGEAQMALSTPTARARNDAAAYLNPTLTRGLVELCRTQPDRPVEWLAHWLLVNKPQLEARRGRSHT